MDFRGTNALITGGGSGIGLGCARHLLRDGATVTLMGRTEQRLRDAADSLRAAAPDDVEVRWSAGDVTDEDAVRKAVAVADEGDGLGIVVASAGVGWVEPIPRIPVAAWRNVLEVNLTGTFLTMKHAVPRMARRGGGAFTAISSVAGQLSIPYLSPYNVAKAGVDAFVRSAADELGKAGIRVNSVLPGIVPTDLATHEFEDDEIVRRYLENMPVRRVGTVEDVAAAVRFLSGPEASWITGVLLPVDGGHHLRRGDVFEPYVAREFGPEWLTDEGYRIFGD